MQSGDWKRSTEKVAQANSLNDLTAQPRKSEFAKTWLTGYLSGMNAGNFFLGDKTDYLKENSVNENINWMTNFCKENSNGLVVTGANKLVGELYRKHQKP